MIEAIVCDMDGLLIDSETQAIDAWMEVGRRRRWEITEEDIERVVGTNSAETYRILSSLFRERFGNEFPFDDILHETERAIEEDSKNGVPLKAGAREFLDAVSASPFRLALCTSTESDKARSILSTVGLLDYFEIVVGGEMVAHSKPAPDIYMLCADRLQVEPRQCVAFEDSYHGVRAAHGAGMRVYMIPDRLAPTPEMIELSAGIYRNLIEAKKVIVEGVGS